MIPGQPSCREGVFGCWFNSTETHPGRSKEQAEQFLGSSVRPKVSKWSCLRQNTRAGGSSRAHCCWLCTREVSALGACGSSREETLLTPHLLHVLFNPSQNGWCPLKGRAISLTGARKLSPSEMPCAYPLQQATLQQEPLALLPRQQRLHWGEGNSAKGSRGHINLGWSASSALPKSHHFPAVQWGGNGITMSHHWLLLSKSKAQGALLSSHCSPSDLVFPHTFFLYPSMFSLPSKIRNPRFS